MTTTVADPRIDGALPSHLTPGIVAGLEIRLLGRTGSGGLAEQGRLVLQPGSALTAHGKLVHVEQSTGVDIPRAADIPGGRCLNVVLLAGGADGTGLPRVRVQLDDRGLPPDGVKIATLSRVDGDGLRLAPVPAGLGGRRLTVGRPDRPDLVVDEGQTMVTGTLTVSDDAVTGFNQAGVVVGHRAGAHLRIDDEGVNAGSGADRAELHLQRHGGETRFGGPVEGPEYDPLNIIGGSDLSLGGGGVLMLGRPDGPNLVLDENEIMARDTGRSAALMLQWDGGETRFGGPLRGPVDGPLRVVGGTDLSLGGEGVLLIGSKEAHHLMVDENEIMAGNGGHTADLYMQWRGGGTSFGGPISGPSHRPLNVVGERDASLPGGGFLSVGPEDQGHVVVDDRRILARRGRVPSALEVQGEGGTTRLGGRLEFRPGGHLAAWIEPDGGGQAVVRCDRSTVIDPIDVEGALDAVDRLRPVTYRLSDPDQESDREILGFVAEEVAELSGDLVASLDDIEGPDGADGGSALGVRPADFAVIAIAAIKEQQKRIDRLEDLVADLVDLA